MIIVLIDIALAISNIVKGSNKKREKRFWAFYVSFGVIHPASSCLQGWERAPLLEGAVVLGVAGTVVILIVAFVIHSTSKVHRRGAGAA